MIVVVFHDINVFVYILILENVAYLSTSLYFSTKNRLYKKKYDIYIPISTHIQGEMDENLTIRNEFFNSNLASLNTKPI